MLPLACLALSVSIACLAQGEPLPGRGGRLIVLGKSANEASLIDAQTGATLATLETGVGPHEVAVSADGKLAVACNYGNRFAQGRSLTVYDLGQGEVLRVIDLGEYRRPHGVVFLGGSRRVLVTAEAQEALLEVDVEAGEVLRAVVTGQRVSHMVAVTPDAKRAFVANIGSGSVSAVDLEAWTLLRNVPTGEGAEGIAVRPDGKEVWIANRGADTVTVVDVATLEVLEQLPCPGFPIRVAFTPDGARALVTCPTASRVSVFDAAERGLVGGIEIALEVAEGSEAGIFGDRFRGPQPIGVLVRPDGLFAYVACSRANRIAVVDLEKLETTGSFATGREPDGMAWY